MLDASEAEVLEKEEQGTKATNAHKANQQEYG
jgi:hypothetical protein